MEYLHLTNNLPIHLNDDSIITKVTLFQSQLDGMCALIHYCEGILSSGNGQPPGMLELIFHYRTIREAVYQYKKEKNGTINPSETTT